MTHSSEAAGRRAAPRRQASAGGPPEALPAATFWQDSAALRRPEDACAALKRRDLAIGARAGAQRTGAPRRGGRRGARGGVGRARTGRLRERPSRRGGGLSAARAARRATLLRRRQPLFRAGAWRRAAASVAGSFGGAAFIPPTRARPPARPPALRPCPFAGAGALAGEHLLPLLARLLPCPVARRALARPPHRARSARMLAAAAARPRAATLAPTLPHARSVEGQSACLWHRRSSDRASGRCSAPPCRASLLRPSALAPPTQSAVAPRLNQHPSRGHAGPCGVCDTL